MCIIVYKPSKLKIKQNDIKLMFQANPDGAGITYYHKGLYHVVKGLMTIEDVITAVEPLQKLDLVLHFRIATSGEITPHQTHPFIVSTSLSEILYAHKGKIVLAHNGIISGYGDEKHSDTIDFIQSTLSKIASSKTRMKLLQATGSKYAYGENGKFHLIGHFSNYKGLSVSNMAFKPFQFYAGKNRRKNNYLWKDDYYGFDEMDGYTGKIWQKDNY